MPAADALLQQMPSRPRTASECAFVVTLLFVPGLGLSMVPGAAWPWLLGASFIVFAGWALALARRRGGLAAAMLAGVAATLWATAVERPPVPARLGVEVVDRDGHAEIMQVVAGSAADGTLRAGDRIIALANRPLDVSRPAEDLRARLRDEGQVPRGETVLTVVRDGVTAELTVRLPPVSRGPGLRGADLPRILLRGLAVLLVVGALLLADGQSAYHIGLAREGFLREALLGVPVLLGTLAVHLSLIIPIALALSRTGFASREASQRIGALQGLTGDVSLWQFALSMVVVAAFEEGLFRGFLLPRVRHLTGRWALAVALVPLLFGLGHLYEGVLAVVQTAVLGVCFSLAFLWRGHLASAIVAHAAFNTLMFTLLVALQRSGLLEKMTQGP